MSSLVIDCSADNPVPEEVPLTPEQQAILDAAAAEQAADTVTRRRVELGDVQAAQQSQTDWIFNHPTDIDPQTLTQITNNLPAWQGYRQALRALPILTVAPTEILWPTHPIRPAVSLTPPPEYIAGHVTPAPVP